MINLIAVLLILYFKILLLNSFVAPLFPFFFFSSEASIYVGVHWQHGGYYLCFHGASQLRFFCALLCVTGILNPLFSCIFFLFIC